MLEFFYVLFFNILCKWVKTMYSSQQMTYSSAMDVLLLGVFVFFLSSGSFGSGLFSCGKFPSLKNKWNHIINT